MVRRRGDDEAVAVAESPARTPEQIAAAVGEEARRIRHDKLVASLTRWRELCRSIASGHEPGGRELAEIAELADVLRLPPAALAESVAAIQREQQLADQAAELNRQAKEAARQGPELLERLAAAEAKVRELQAEYHGGRNLLHRLALETNNLGNLRREHELVFGNASAIAGRLLEWEARGGAMSSASIGKPGRVS